MDARADPDVHLRVMRVMVLFGKRLPVSILQAEREGFQNHAESYNNRSGFAGPPCAAWFFLRNSEGLHPNSFRKLSLK